MSLNKEAPSSVTILQAIVFIQFGLCFSITVLTTIGLSFGYPVASFYLMALLQVIVAVPGIVYIALQQNITITRLTRFMKALYRTFGVSKYFLKKIPPKIPHALTKLEFSPEHVCIFKITSPEVLLVWIAVYISFQLVTASCEIYWLVYMIFDGQSAGSWLGLSVLTAVNILAVVVALWFRQAALKIPFLKKNKNNEEKPELKVPSTSMSEVEKPKSDILSSKSTPSTRKSPAKSSSEKSSKGSLKVRKAKKALSMPLDSRETTSRSRTSMTNDVSEKN